MTVEALKKDFEHHLRYTLGRDQYTATDRDRYYSLALAVRDRLIERWMTTQQVYHKQNVKRIYYLSLEFLIGRLLGSNVMNLRMEDICQKAMKKVGLDYHALRDFEVDAGLGNGGLGRLAACFMDSLATLHLPAVGYGIRYDYGIFNQKIVNGYQVEEPDPWLKNGYPWEICHPEYACEVKFEGEVEARQGPEGVKWDWIKTKSVIGMPYDLPIIGYDRDTVITLRLWSARAAEDFDLDDFNRGEYEDAVEGKMIAETLTKVLYPNDNVFVGKELRLRQQYFFVACSLSDIIRRFKTANKNWSTFPKKAFIQLNDTHPSLVIPELMRVLMDREGLGWDEAWCITTASTGYTNHTILPEALEKWPISMMQKILPRHLQIINEINARFLQEVARRFPFDNDRLRRMSIIEEDNGKNIRMAHLAVVGSCSTNGVSKIHTKLLRKTVLKDFAELWPERINNKTNGITPRRWLLKANHRLADLITEVIGEGWKTDLMQLRRLKQYAGNKKFRESFRNVKQINKTKLSDYIFKELGVSVSPDSIFDVQVKRLHEYKRQLLLILYAIIRYNRLKDNPNLDLQARTFIFGAKAAPDFVMAKLIIKLIHQVGLMINDDKALRDKIKLVFLPNYRVSLAERIIPAANLSEQISLAGTEASGTGNMKLQLNGALTIGTLDGANIEIMEEVGKENIFIFGMTAEEVEKRRPAYNPWDIYNNNPEIKRAIDMIDQGFFSLMEPGIFSPIIHSLLNGGDRYMLLADLESFVETQTRVDAIYADPDEWDRKAIYNVAGSGKFSSDRTINEYAKKIWHVKPCCINHKFNKTSRNTSKKR